MNIKTGLSAAVLCAALLPNFSLAANRQMKLIEDAIETEEYKLVLHADGMGNIAAKKCETCQEQVLQFTAKTQAFEKQQVVPLKKLEQQRPKFIVIFFDPQTMEVTRVKW